VELVQCHMTVFFVGMGVAPIQHIRGIFIIQRVSYTFLEAIAVEVMPSPCDIIVICQRAALSFFPSIYVYKMP
jgi:hypothetical protein